MERLICLFSENLTFFPGDYVLVLSRIGNPPSFLVQIVYVEPPVILGHFGIIILIN